MSDFNIQKNPTNRSSYSTKRNSLNEMKTQTGKLNFITVFQ